MQRSPKAGNSCFSILRWFLIDLFCFSRSDHPDAYLPHDPPSTDADSRPAAALLSSQTDRDPKTLLKSTSSSISIVHEASLLEPSPRLDAPHGKHGQQGSDSTAGEECKDEAGPADRGEMKKDELGGDTSFLGRSAEQGGPGFAARPPTALTTLQDVANDAADDSGQRPAQMSVTEMDHGTESFPSSGASTLLAFTDSRDRNDGVGNVKIEEESGGDGAEGVKSGENPR